MTRSGHDHPAVTSRWRALPADARSAAAARRGRAGSRGGRPAGNFARYLPLALGLALLAWLAEWDWGSREFARWVPIIELGVAGLLLGLPNDHSPATFLPYLLTASAASAARWGSIAALSPSVCGRRSGGLARDPVGMDRESAPQLTEWLLLSALGVFTGSWARSWERQGSRSPNKYQAANILLTQLRDVTRELPTGLDK